MPNEDTDGGDDQNLYRLEVHFANAGAFRGIYPDDVSTILRGSYNSVDSKGGRSGGRGRDRTYDQSIKSRMLTIH